MAQRYWTAGVDLAVVCIKQKQCFPEALALPGPDQIFFCCRVPAVWLSWAGPLKLADSAELSITQTVVCIPVP